MLSGLPPASVAISNQKWTAETLKNAKGYALSLSRTVYDATLGGQGTPLATVSLAPADLDFYVSTHTDVWVETAEHHASLYASSGVPQLVHPNAVPPSLIGDLSSKKKLSGDVGGVIAEGLLVAALRHAFACSDEDYVHLSSRHRKRFPDFAIVHPGPVLGAHLYGAAVHGPPDLVPAEVKMAARVDRRGGIGGQIAKGLVQLVSFWQLVRAATPPGPSILFLAVRNPKPPVRSYDLALIHGQ